MYFSYHLVSVYYKQDVGGAADFAAAEAACVAAHGEPHGGTEDADDEAVLPVAQAKVEVFSSAVGQIVNFLGTLQNEWAGAQAFSSFDTYMAPFVRLDSMTYNLPKKVLLILLLPARALTHIK